MKSCVIMCVYKNDDVNKFTTALDSIFIECRADLDVFLAVDGPVGSKLSSSIAGFESRYPQLNVIYYRERKGLTALLNLMIEQVNNLAIYDLIFRFDPDDVNINNRFTEQINFMKENLEIDVCGSLSIDVWPAGKITIRSLPENHDEIVSRMKFRNPLKHSTICMRSNIFEYGARYNEWFLRSQDRVLWTDLITNGQKFHIIQKPLVQYENDVEFIKRKKSRLAKKYTSLAQLYTIRKLAPFSLKAYVYLILLIMLKYLPSFLLLRVFKYGEKWT